MILVIQIKSHHFCSVLPVIVDETRRCNDKHVNFNAVLSLHLPDRGPLLGLVLS